MIEDFILNALLAGSLIALVAGPLGCFLVWRHMAYFGDTISHSALVGVALGLVLGTTSPLVMVAVCASVALLLLLLQRDRSLSSDTILGLLAHSALSIGLIVISLQAGLRQDMMFYLIGDILAIGPEDVLRILMMAVLVLGAFILIWKPLLAITVHEDLARVEGVPVGRVKVAYMLMIAVLVALAIKLVGVLLVTALMIIPAAGARNLTRTPLAMTLMSALIGVIAVFGGVGLSGVWDVPTGPAIVLSAVLIFSVSRVFYLFSKR